MAEGCLLRTHPSHAPVIRAAADLGEASPELALWDIAVLGKVSFVSYSDILMVSRLTAPLISIQVYFGQIAAAALKLLASKANFARHSSGRYSAEATHRLQQGVPPLKTVRGLAIARSAPHGMRREILLGF